MTDEEFESTFRVNTFSPFYLARAVYNSWEKHGISMAKEHNKLILFVRHSLPPRPLSSPSFSSLSPLLLSVFPYSSLPPSPSGRNRR